MRINTFCHSGALGDLIYSLPLVKHFGGGKFYLHLNQMDWIGQHYYGSPPDPFHQGRLTLGDFEFMKDFMLAQTYITEFNVLDPKLHEITHNLDRFRPLFVGHTANYVDTFCMAFGILDKTVQTQISNQPWITVPTPRPIAGRPIVINRTARWIPKLIGEQWGLWKQQGIEAQSVFVGLPQEHLAFCQATGWVIPHQPTHNMLELAEYIAGSDQFIGNQSVALSIAIGLGKEFYCEARRDLPLEKNECYFPNQPNGHYF